LGMFCTHNLSCYKCSKRHITWPVTCYIPLIPITCSKYAWHGSIIVFMKPLRSGICQVQAIVPILLCPQKFWLAQNFLTNTVLSTISCTRHIPLNGMVFICGLFRPSLVLLHGIMYRSSWIFMI
jgi:hypothetical protein